MSELKLVTYRLGASLLFATATIADPRAVSASPAFPMEIAHFMAIAPRVACENVITPGYVAQWLGWIECDQKRLRIQYAYGIGVQPLKSSGTELWKKRESVAGAVLESVLQAGDEGLVLTATYGRWSFKSHVRNDQEGEEVLGILRTLQGKSE